MRIGFFTDGFLPQPNGVATSVYETAKELERRGHEVFIIAPKFPHYKDRGSNVIRLASINIHEPTKTRIALNLPDKDLRKVLAIEFDIIHGHSGGPITLLGWEVARSKKIPYVVTYHTLWNRYTHYFLKGKVVTPKMMERATKIFGNRVDLLIAPTSRVEKELRSYGVKKPMRVVPSGINIEEFSGAKKGELRRRLDLGNKPVALYVGRLGREKLVSLIIESFAKVLLEVPDAQLVLAGDGEEKSDLVNLAKKLEITKSIHFIGDVEKDEMPEVYKDADIFVFASKTETQGLVVPEALASGLPVVVNDDPAFECIKNGQNGYRVDLSPDDFSEKIVYLLKDKEKRREMSSNAEISAQKFSIKETVDGLEAAYFELLEKSNRESVAQIMGQNASSENFFVVDLLFWIAVFGTRMWVFLFPPANHIYPGIGVGGQIYSLAAIGIIVFLLGLAAFFAKRSMSLLSLVLIGVGGGLVASEGWSLFSEHGTLLNYWNPLNIIPILFFGLIPVIFIRTNIKDRPKFYINTPLLKHKNPENPHVTVVIPAYNEGEFIEPTLKSLLNQTYKNFELIVVNNNSTDNTAEIAEKYGARVLLEKEKGVAYARQKGFLEARGSIIASTDADSVVPEGWLAEIVKKYDSDPHLAGFGGLNNLYSGPVTARAAGRFLFPLFWRIDKFMNHGWNLVGFNMSVRKSYFVKIGGFNAALPMGEDVDLAQRLRAVGNVDIDPTLLVFSSGRRFRSGLILGVMSYAPYWISKVVLHRDKPFAFKDVRSENGESNSFGYIPLGIVVIFLFILFYIAIPRSY